MIEQISGVAPTPTVHLVERAPNNPVQTPDLDSFQPACSAQWREPGPPQDLVDQQVPQAGQPPLILQPSLEWLPPPDQSTTQPG